MYALLCFLCIVKLNFFGLQHEFVVKKNDKINYKNIKKTLALNKTELCLQNIARLSLNV